MRKMKRLLFIVIAFAFPFILFAGNAETLEGEGTESSYKYQFIGLRLTPTEQELSDIEEEGIESRYSAFLLQRLKACTFTKEDVVPGESVQRTVAHKQDIYNAVKNIRRGLEKAVDHDPSLKSKAQKEFESVVNVAIAAFYDDNSSAFEKDLRANRKDYNKQIAIFSSVSMK